jgi:hypothetical protein
MARRFFDDLLKPARGASWAAGAGFFVLALPDATPPTAVDALVVSPR